MGDNSLYDMIHQEYKINITPAEYERLCDVLTMYNVHKAPFNIDVHSDMKTFANNAHLMKKINFRRGHTSIELEDVVYMMRPMTVGSYDCIKTIYPNYFTKKESHDIPRLDDDIDENILLIRTLKYETRGLPEFEERFTLMVYNKNLNVHAGIRFEKYKKGEL